MTLRIDSEAGVRKNLDFVLGILGLILAALGVLLIAIGILIPPSPKQTSPANTISHPFPYPSVEYDELVPESVTGTPVITSVITPVDTSVGSGEPRSGHWPAVRTAYFSTHPHCEFHGCTCRGPFNVHHVEPFHINPAKELDPTNLITLCVGGPNHHLYVGHNGNFQDVNPNVREDCKRGVFPAKGLELKKRHDAMSKRTLAP